MSKYSTFFAAYNASVKAGNPYSKEEQVSIFTQGRTSSLRELSDQELKELTAQLNGQVNAGDKADKLRKALISIFHKMQYQNAAAAAKAWAEKMGVGAKENNVKKPFNEYTPQELKRLIYKAEIALADFKRRIDKKM